MTACGQGISAADKRPRETGESSPHLAATTCCPTVATRPRGLDATNMAELCTALKLQDHTRRAATSEKTLVGSWISNTGINTSFLEFFFQCRVAYTLH